jgi:hypothetical protein
MQKMKRIRQIVKDISTFGKFGKHLLISVVCCSVLFELNLITYGKTDWYVNCIIMWAIILAVHLTLVMVFLKRKI